MYSPGSGEPKLDFEPASTSERWGFKKNLLVTLYQAASPHTICSWGETHVSSLRVVVNNRRRPEAEAGEARGDASRHTFNEFTELFRFLIFTHTPTPPTLLQKIP